MQHKLPSWVNYYHPHNYWSFPCGSAGKESAYNVGDLGLIPGLGRSPREGKGYPLQYSGLENSVDHTVHGVTKSWTRLNSFHFPRLLSSSSLTTVLNVWMNDLVAGGWITTRGAPEPGRGHSWLPGLWQSERTEQGFPGGSVLKESACQCRRYRLDSWVRKIPREGDGNPFQSSCLENPMGKGGWWAIVHGITSVRHDLATKPQQHTVDGYVNWYSHYVKQHDIPKKRKTRNKTTIWSGSSNTGSTSEKIYIYMYI